MNKDADELLCLVLGNNLEVDWIYIGKKYGDRTEGGLLELKGLKD